MWIRLYSLLWVVALPFVMLRLLLRSVREPGYREELRGRFGLGPDGPAGALWVHAVSAGEVHAVAPLLSRLAADMPVRPLLVTCSTATGRARLRARFGDRVRSRWLPFDLPRCVDAFLDRQRPALLVLVETELWPVLVARCALRGIPVVLVSARLSARSARGYGRLSALSRPMLARLTRVLCADEATAERMAKLGARRAALAVTGSLKFEPDFPRDVAARVATLRRQVAPDVEPAFVIVAGSTHPGEEAALLAALLPWLDREPSWHLVLVPRHPQRFDAVARLCAGSGRGLRRASEPASGARARLLLWDRMGELALLYGAADAAFLGGSLVPAGGHNPIEAAWHGVPVVVGPEAWNFAELNARLAEGGGLTEERDAAAVSARFADWARDPAERRRRGAAARATVRANAGATARTAAELAALLQSTT